MNPVVTAVTTTVCVDRRTAFGLIAPIDLTTIFTGYGVLPAVISTKQQTGDWNTVGQQRMVLLSDGSSTREHLTGYDPACSFSYRLSEFTGVFSYFVRVAHGTWWFDEHVSGQTVIRWQYAFTPRSLYTLPVLWLFTHTVWRSYMRDVLARAMAQLPQDSLLQAAASYRG